MKFFLAIFCIISFAGCSSSKKEIKHVPASEAKKAINAKYIQPAKVSPEKLAKAFKALQKKDQLKIEKILSALPKTTAAVLVAPPKAFYKDIKKWLSKHPRLIEEYDAINKRFNRGKFDFSHFIIAAIQENKGKTEIAIYVDHSWIQTTENTTTYKGYKLNRNKNAIQIEIGDDLLIGSEAFVKNIIEHLEKPQQARWAKRYRKYQDAPLWLSVDLSGLKGQLPKEFKGIDEASFTIGENYQIELTLIGSDDFYRNVEIAWGKLEKMIKLLDTLASVNNNYEKALLFSGGRYFAELAYHELTPKREKGALILRYKVAPELLSPKLTLPFVGGVLAAIAVPAFVKYLRKSKTIEASEGLDVLKMNIQSYPTKKLAKLKSTPWLPQKSCCNGGNLNCKNLNTASHKTFKALQFDKVPRHYQFRLTKKGRGKSLKIKIEARGDLDCNNVYSNFSYDFTFNKGALEVSPLHVKDEIE